MFRLAKAPESQDATFFLLCDHRQCMEARRGLPNMTNPEEYRLSKKLFVETARTEGWLIDLEGIYCPFHSREIAYMAKEAQERQQQVVPANGADVVAFGKSK